MQYHDIEDAGVEINGDSEDPREEPDFGEILGYSQDGEENRNSIENQMREKKTIIMPKE